MYPLSDNFSKTVLPHWQYTVSFELTPYLIIKEIYTEHTKLKKKDLDAILKKDNDWYADECLKNGLVDELI